MKFNISAMELNALISEMQELISAKVDKIFHPEKRELLLRLHVPGKGRRTVRIVVPDFMYITEYRQNAGEPSSFCMFLRKRLANARLRQINQLGFERIAEFVFEKKQGEELKTYRLLFEFFLKGNIILCDSDYNIISPLEMQKWSGRVVKAKIKYEYPRKKYNFLKIDLNDLNQLFKQTEERGLVLVLAKDLGLGGPYSEEICLISKINKAAAPEDVSGKMIEELFSAIKKIREIKQNPAVIKHNGETKAIIPFKMLLYKDNEWENFESYNKALDEVLTTEKIIELEQTSASEQRKDENKAVKIIEMQKKKLKQVEETIKECNEAADLIYTNYKIIADIIDTLNQAKKKYTWKEIKDKLRGHKIIKEILPKEKCLIIELK